MSQSLRLAKGGHIDREKLLKFTFNGKKMYGYEGDTLASGLLANAERLVGRSFKYHRPRGIMTNGPEEPNAMVQLEEGAHSTPNILATMQPLYDELLANPQNCWPNVDFDLLSINQYFAPLLASGFYYKTFMYPRHWWMKYEHWIRRSAGLGKASGLPDPDDYLHYHEHADVMVVGAGPAGIAAALTAARMGAKVVLADERTLMGGTLLDEPASDVADPEYQVLIEGKSAVEWRHKALEELQSMSNVRLLPSTTITYYGHQNYLVGAQRLNDQHKPEGDEIRQILWRVRASQVVLATGTIERGPCFLNNDRPGVMTSSALRGYINHYAVLPAKSICIFTNNDSGYRTAIDATRAGATVQVLDARSHTEHPDALNALRQGVVIQMGAVVNSTSGRGHVRDVHCYQISESGQILWNSPRTIHADILAVSSGFTPTVHLYSQAKGRLRFDETIQGYLPDGISCATHVCGGVGGDIRIDECIASGHRAGIDAAKAVGIENKAARRIKVEQPYGECAFKMYPLYLIDKDLQKPSQGKRFVDVQNDSTAGDLALAQREGYRSIELVKRYTTTGMGTDQGKLGNMNAIAIVSGIRRQSIPEVGVTTYRPPYTPVSFGALTGAGREESFEQVRGTPLHIWHTSHGAVFENVGDWKRARYYPKSGEDMNVATQRESLAVRTDCGIFDGSTLGKIDIQGSDSVKLLNMLYTNSFTKLAVGKARYGVMLNEHGMIFDDGVTTRIAEQHFHMTTTTGGAARVLAWIEEMLQTEWLDWQVHATSVTEEWAVIALNGPKARDILAPLCDAPIDAETLPFMSYTELNIAGIPARIFRISFTGEMAFEINVPARYGKSLWEKIVQQGGDLLTPYGTEAMHLLRAEKGFIIVGQDTDGTLTPHDASLSWLVSQKKEDFLGKRSLVRSDSARDDRKQFVGLETMDGKTVLPEGTHLINTPSISVPTNAEGHITSSYYSPILKMPIALAVIRRGNQRMGETIYAVDPETKSTIAMKVVDPVFYDKEGKKARE